MTYYPAFLDLRGKKVLVVGGGAVAQRKIETLTEYGASVLVVAKDLTPSLTTYMKEGRLLHLGTEFQESDMEGAFLVFAATDDPQLNRRISRSARIKGVLVNVVDQPADCTFIVPSVLRRGDLVIAVSTSGKSPALAMRLREKLGGVFGAEYEPYVKLLGKLREDVFSRSLPPGKRREIFRDLVRSDLAELIRLGDWPHLASTVSAILDARYSAEDLKDFLNNE